MDSGAYNNQLKWWREKSSKFPCLTKLARPFLAITATQAETECMFSTTGSIVLCNRRRPDPAHVRLLVFLRNTWMKVD
ncbi:unnamed protein product, partial [Choristocarpus tenellus]